MKFIKACLTRIRKDLRFMLSTTAEVNQENSLLFIMDKASYYKRFAEVCQENFEHLIGQYQRRIQASNKILGIIEHCRKIDPKLLEPYGRVAVLEEHLLMIETILKGVEDE